MMVGPSLDGSSNKRKSYEDVLNERDVHKEEEKKKKKMKEEESNQVLWDEMERALLEDLEAEPQIGNLETNRNPSNSCEHDTILDKEIGVYCKSYGFPKSNPLAYYFQK
ncbi:hypothetical protein P8452_44562 [Trifolium repens]|nr:hypothetical protein P8452_44562 [Trifolium repens]